MSLLGKLVSMLGGKGQVGPPKASEVVARAYALNAVIVYAKTIAASGHMPGQLRNLAADEISKIDGTAAAIAGKITGAAEQFGFRGALSPNEARLLSIPFSKLDDQTLRDATWRMEALQVATWALTLIDRIPSYEAQADDSLLGLLPLEKYTELYRTARLRPAAELEAARSLAEFWHWRSRTRQCIEEGQPFPEITSTPDGPSLKSFDDVVRFTAQNMNESGMDVDVMEEDFKIRGKAFRNLTTDEWAEVSSVIVERHFALNWLCGKAPANRWDETPTGT